MIDFIRGQVVERDMDSVVIETHGIGYRVFCTQPYELDENGLVYIYDHLFENGRTLYGFSTRDEQRLFRKLIGVSGIGPKSALAIMAATQPKGLIMAVLQEDITGLSKLPGIGKKTAQRMILDLKDGLKEFSSWVSDMPANARKTIILDDSLGRSSNSGFPEAWVEAKSALIGLGYTDVECQRSFSELQKKFADGDQVSVEQWIKAALQQFAVKR